MSFFPTAFIAHGKGIFLLVERIWETFFTADVGENGIPACWALFMAIMKSFCLV
jgi:hypothetical protein